MSTKPRTERTVGFTPGPWKLETWHYQDHRGDLLVICTDNDAIAFIHDLYRENDTETMGKAETLANAHQIKAAPTMYEALNSNELHGLVDDCNTIADNVHKWTRELALEHLFGMRNRIRRLEELAAAALALADGK
jgi:hypothetical protein